MPTNKNGEDPTAPSHPDLLLCYKAKATNRFGTLGVTIENQFGTGQGTLIHRRELCVPSEMLLDPGWYRDEVDNGDDPFFPGCHRYYSDPVCTADMTFFAGDKCLSATSLEEYYDTTCHRHRQRDGRDIKPYTGISDCNALCFPQTGTCVTFQNACQPGDSAACVCGP
jgi:hypothetical protein